MIRKQKVTENTREKEAEEVKVLIELAEVLKKQVSGIKEIKKKVEEKRIIERNPPKLASLTTKYGK